MFYFAFKSKFQVQAPPGGLYDSRGQGGDLTKGFLRYDWGAYIRRGIYMEGLIFGIYGIFEK